MTAVFSTANGPRLTVSAGRGLERVVYPDDGSAPAAATSWRSGQLVFAGLRPLVFDVSIAVARTDDDGLLLLKPAAQYHIAEFESAFGFPESHGIANMGYCAERIIGVHAGSYRHAGAEISTPDRGGRVTSSASHGQTQREWQAKLLKQQQQQQQQEQQQQQQQDGGEVHGEPAVGNIFSELAEDALELESRYGRTIFANT